MSNFDPTVEHCTKGSSADNAGLVRSNGANSQHFLGKETNTSNLSTYHCDTYLATALDYARTEIDRPTTIKSGYRKRGPVHGLGVSLYSEHTFACAADILPTGGWTSHAELFAVAFSLHDCASAYGIKGIGIYDYSADPKVSNSLTASFIHIDVGRGPDDDPPREHRTARWYQWREEGNTGINYAVYFVVLPPC